MALKELDGVIDHPNVFLQVDAEAFPHCLIPAPAGNGDNVGTAGQQGLAACVLIGGDPAFAGPPISDQPGAFQGEFFRLVEKFHILFGGRRIAPLNEQYA